MEDASDKINVEEGDIPGYDIDLATILQAAEVEESPFGEYIKDCPVCKSAVRYFFVNFNEKLKMCENKECHYPFGYEDLEFVKQDDTLPSDAELESITISRQTYSGSVISTTAWSDIDKLNKAYDSEDQCDIPIQRHDADSDAKLQEVLRQKEADLQTKKNVQDMKKLNVQLQKTYETDDSCIKNEKWIKHLQTLQSMSGLPLLKNEEMALVSRTELGPQELTIGIENGSASITINLAKPSASTEKATRKGISTRKTEGEGSVSDNIETGGIYF